MNVTELRDALRLLPGDMPVVLASDAEGNNYRHLADVGTYAYAEEDRELWLLDDEDIDDSDPRAFLLWPM